QVMFTVGDATVEEAAGIADRVRRVLARNHHFAPGDLRAVRVRNNLESFHEIQQIFIADNYGFAEAVVGTVAAGVDVVVVGNNLAYEPDVAARIIDLLAAAVADGRLSEARIDESYRRIMALKAKWAGQD
ncbi:MAG: hypothetical protein KDD77_21040, partial [Caldilineaceae bacterium]|nr:hypothetical protein [Caldilineaceae bacterium]